MKKNRLLFLATFMLLFSACSGKPDETVQPGATGVKEEQIEEDLYSICWFGPENYSDLGVLQTRQEGEHKGVSYFFDPVSEREVPLCVKTNCSHQGYSWGNTNPTCDACLSEDTSCVAIIGDTLYYVSRDPDDGLFRRKIYRANPDGTNRRVLEVVENAEIFSSGCYVDGYLIFTYYTQDAQDGTKLEKNQTGICLYNLESEEAEYITASEYYNAIISTATVQDNCLYYLYHYLTEDLSKISYEDMTDEYKESIVRRELWSYDLNTKEQRLVVKDEEKAMGTASIRWGYAYLEGSGGAETRLIRLSTGESRELPFEMVQHKGQAMGEEGVFLYGGGSIDLWEFETGEVKHIGDYDEDWDITFNYIGRKWVYGWKIENGQGRIFYLPKEQFMKGDLEWKYLPQEDQ